MNRPPSPLSFLDRGSGPVLLLVHAFPLHRGMWRAQVEEFSRRFRVLAPDLRGFGESPPRGPVMSMADHADDLAAMLAHLEIREPVAYCGLSLGGYIGWQFAQRHRTRLGRLIVCDSRAAADSPEAAQARRKMADRVLAEGTEFVASAMLPRLVAAESLLHHPQLETELRRWISQATPAGIAATQLGMAARPDVSASLATLNVPALVVCGELDAITPPAEMQTLAQALRARYVEIPASGHLSALENSRVFNAAVLEFLSGHGG